jgi:hypothetical protein
VRGRVSERIAAAASTAACAVHRRRGLTGRDAGKIKGELISLRGTTRAPPDDARLDAHLRTTGTRHRIEWYPDAGSCFRSGSRCTTSLWSGIKRLHALFDRNLR